MGRNWLNWGRGKNDHEAGGSRRRREPSPPPSLPPPPPLTRLQRAQSEQVRSPPPSPPPSSQAPFRLVPARVRERPYLNKRRCQWYWDRAIPVPWPDVHLSDGWHLNRDRIPVPPVPRSGAAREAEIRRRRDELPPDLRAHPAFAVNSPHWDTWFTDEHDLRRRSYFGARRARGEPQFPPPSPPRQARRGAAPQRPLRIGGRAPVVKDEPEEEPPQWFEEEDDQDVDMAEPEPNEELQLAMAIEASRREAEAAAEAEARALEDALAAVAAQQAAEAAEARAAGARAVDEAVAAIHAQRVDDYPYDEEVDDDGRDENAPVPAWFEPLVGMRWRWEAPPPEHLVPPPRPATPPPRTQPPTPQAARAAPLPPHLAPETPDYVILDD